MLLAGLKLAVDNFFALNDDSDVNLGLHSVMAVGKCACAFRLAPCKPFIHYAFWATLCHRGSQQDVALLLSGRFSQVTIE